MMKKIICVLLVVFMIVSFSGCQKKGATPNDATETISCSMCGKENNAESRFCVDCGCGLSPIGDQENFSEENLKEPEPINQSYTLLNFFKSFTDKPLIIYDCEIAKDANVDCAYVIQNGQCRKYSCDATLGNLSKMTDEEIIEMLEDSYKDGLEEACSTWRNEYHTDNAISEGKVKLYIPRSYDIKGCLFTDDTGNSVVGELLFFPLAGVDHSPYIIEYPQYTDAEDKFMNYYGTYEDSDSYRDIKFKVEYFNTGYGTFSDINQINDIFYITNSSMKTGTVYNSHYYALRTMDSEWSDGGDTLCFRVKNPTQLNLKLDSLSSLNVSYIDPTENNILQISRSYYNAYYNSFGDFDSVVEEQLKEEGVESETIVYID